MDNSKCVVLVPVAKSLELETQQALTQLMERGYPVRTMIGGSQVDLVRSMMASKALDDGFEETFWIDSDVVFEPDDVDKLRGHNIPMSAGLYPKKGRDEFACKFHAGTGTLTFGTGGGLVEFWGTGMGFNHVRAEVYHAIAKTVNLPACGGAYDPAQKITPYFLPLIVDEGKGAGPQYFSEDYSFCHLAKQAGFKVMADTSIRLGHVHRHVKTWDDFVPRQTYTSMDVSFPE